MTKDEAALAAYPVLTVRSTYSCGGATDANEKERKAFYYGYEQAEKDLALTWQDIRQIVNLAEEVVKTNTGFESEQEFFDEVLRQFSNNR